MKISVVIASYNRREALACCLATLLDQDLPNDQYEIVVVVDGSSDGTCEMLGSFRSRCELIVVEQENKGQAAARNAGVHAARGEIILFLDDDVLCDRGLISTHLAAHKQPGPSLVMGHLKSVLSPSPTLGERLIHDDLEKYYARLITDPQPRWPENAWVGPNCSLLRASFLEAGGFDANLFPRRWEDVDLGLRLWKVGIHFRFEPRAMTSHRSVKTERQSWADVAEDGACMIRLCRKHPEMRSHSWLAGTMSAPAWKLHAARMACAQTEIARMLLGAVITVFEKVTWLTWAQEVATRLYGIEHSVLLLAGAQREAGSWRRMTGLFRRQLAALLYHQVGEPTSETNNFSLTVSPAKFRRQIHYLRWRGYTAITPAQWLAWCSAGEPLPEKPLLITFDDAFEDLVENAFPILERYGFRSVVFVITGRTGASNTWESLPLMTMRQIQHWAKRGVEFGAHTQTHLDLISASAESAVSEVKGSKEDLVKAGLAPVSFAYPFGSFDDRARKSVDGVFPLAFTCEEGLNDLSTDPLLLKRTMVQPGDTLLDIELRTALGRSPLSLLRARLRIRSRVLLVLRHVLLRP